VFSGRGRSQNGANTSATEGRADSSRRTIAPRSRLIRPEFKNAVSAERWPGVKSERIGTRDQDLRFTAFLICARALDVRMSRNFATDLIISAKLGNAVKTSACGVYGATIASKNIFGPRWI